MKKYRIIDGDGEKFEVEEFETEKDEETCHDEGEEVVLTVEEMSALKALVPHIDAILAMVMAKNETVDEEEEAEEEDTDEEEIFNDADEEKVVETEVEKKTRDSKRSIGAIEKKKATTIDDSLVDEVADAWGKRYGGK